MIYKLLSNYKYIYDISIFFYKTWSILLYIGLYWFMLKFVYYIIFILVYVYFYMGSYEVFFFWLFTFCIISVILYLLACLNWINLNDRFKLFSRGRREFYECGCRVSVQKPPKFSLQFLVICIFFILYDVELLFSIPLVSTISSHSLTEILFFLFLYLSFGFSLIYDIKKDLISWKI